MSIKKIKNYFDPRENLILSQRDEDEEKLSFEEARNLGAQRMRAEKSASANTDAPASRPKLSQPTGRNAGMGLMTELQKNNLSFDAARQIGVQNHALDYQREIRERALKMREELKNQKSPYEELSKEDKGSLARLYSLQNQLKTFSTYNQTNPQGGNPIMQAQNPYNTDIQQEYNNLYSDLNKKGYDVTELMRYYERIKNEEAAEDIQKKLTEKTADHPALMSAASVGLNLLTAQNSFPKAMKDAIYDAAYGTNLGIDTNAPEFFGTYSTNAVREKASGDIVEKTREKYGDGAAWAANLLYGTGMSMADSLTANALGGFTPIGGVIQGINAANSTLIDANERGVSAGKTLLTAAAAGVFEGFFEDVSLSKLKAMQPEMNSTLKAVGKNILKQMGVEGSEESATEIANIIFDSALNGDKSSMALKRAAYVKQGMSPAEATGQVIWDAVRQVAEAGIGGALSGVGFGAGGALTNYAAYNGQVKQIGSEALQSGQYDARLRNALQFDPSSDIGQAAIKMVNKDKVRSKDAGRFTVQYDKAASDAIQNASNEQEVQEAYHKFSSEEDTSGTIALAKMADERIRALALQKVDAERAEREAAREQETPMPAQEVMAETPEMATQETPVPMQERAAGGETKADMQNTTGISSNGYIKRDKALSPVENVESNRRADSVPAEETNPRYSTLPTAKVQGSDTPVKVLGIESTEGGVSVKLADGKTAKLDDLQFDNNEERALYSMAKQFPTDKAKSFVSNYNGSIGLENYTKAFNVLYDAGYKGSVSLEKAMEKFADFPQETQSMLSFLYFAGQNRAAAAKAKQERQPVARGNGQFINKTGEKLDEAMAVLYEGIAAKTGMTVELQKRIQKNANGAFENALSRIIISEDADNQIATLIHETAEYVREYNSKGMLDLQETMLSWFSKTCGFDSLDDLVESYRMLYATNLGEESASEAMNEMFNDACAALFANENGVKDLLNWLKKDSGKTVQQQKRFLQTIVDLFDHLIEKITDYFKNHSLTNAAQVFADGMDIDQMKALRQMFFEAANQARENYDAATQKTADGFAEVESTGQEKASVKMENGEEVGAEQIGKREVKHSLNPNFEQQYDQWDRKNPRWRFNIGTTSEALKSIGIPDKKIVWDSSKIIKIKAKHSGMTDSVIKQVPQILEYPVIVMQSKQSDSRITMFGEVHDQKGKLVLGVIELHPTQNGILMDEFKVASAYGKDNAQRFIDSSEILYIEPNKNRTHDWIRRTGLQLPVGLNQYGPIGRIAYADEDVNSAASTDSSIRNGGQSDTSEGDIKYMFAGEKAKTANLASLERAKQEKESELQPSEMIWRSTGWHQGPDGKWRFEIDDSKARFGDESSNRLGEFLLHDDLYEAYPELREIRVEKLGEDEPKRLRGRYIADEKKIQYDPNLAPKDRMTTLLHEIQHIIQRTEGFGKGGSKDATEAYLFNRAYDYAKTLPSYQSMQTPEQREQFVKDLIAARSRSGDYETALTEAYQNLFGEIEARNTANRQSLDQRGRKIASPTNPKESIVVTDWLEEAIRYKRNRTEINDTVALAGEERYNQGKGGEMHDEETGVRDHALGNVSRGQRGAVPSVSSEKSKTKPDVRSDSSIRRIGTEPEGREEGVYGRQRSVSGIAGASSQRTSSELIGGITNDQTREARGMEEAELEGNLRGLYGRQINGGSLSPVRPGRGGNVSAGSGDSSESTSGERGVHSQNARLQLKIPEEGTPEYAEMLSKWGAMKPGFKPFREIKVPKKTSKNKKVRTFVRTVMESNAITDEMAEDLKGEIVKEAMSYTVISDKKAQDAAKDILKKNGIEGGWKHWNSIVDGDKMPDKKDIALGEYLLRTAAENGDKAEVMRLIAEISEIGTRMGQSVQALSMLKKMGGAGQLVYVQRTVDTLNKDLIKRFKGKAFAKVTLNEKLAENLVVAQTQEEIDVAQMELYRDIADQLPPTWIDKWNAWRYLSMLGNVKTHIRNILGNAVFAPVVRLKDAVGAGIEAMTVHDGERTKAVVVKQEYREFAKQDYPNVRKELHRGGKQNPMREIYEQRVIFNGSFAGKVGEKVAGSKGRKAGEKVAGWVEKARKFNDNAMEWEDDLFLRQHYQSHLAQYLQANKIDLSKITEKQLERARNYAILEAKKATFRDESAIARKIQHFSNSNIAANILVESQLPFKKTPINILKRGVEYSPLGLMETVAKRFKGLREDGSVREEDAGKMTASEFVDGLASGLTGTGIMLMGTLLSAMGWVSGGSGDDKEDKLAKLQGEQEYALRIGGFTYTIDWTAPAALPFFVGVELMEALKEDYDDMPLRAIFDALGNIAEPLLNISFLDGLNNTLNSVSFADGADKVGALISSVLTNYFMQAIPALSGQTARSVDPTRRRTYIDKNSQLPEFIQIPYQKLLNKIPFLSYLNQPYIDEWGREDKTQNIVVRAFENFLSPGWFSEVKTSDMEQELKRLYEATGESGVLPGYAAKYITVNGEKINLTGDEYTLFATVRGQTAYSTIGEIIASEEYGDMSDAQKVKAVKDAFEFAGSAAKAAVSEYELEGWKQDANEESQEEGVSIGEAIAHRAATNGAAPEIASILQDDGAEAAQEKIDRMMKACASRDEMKDQKGNVKSAITRAYKKKYIKYHDAGDVEGMRKIRQELMQLRTPVGKLYTMKDFRNWIV